MKKLAALLVLFLLFTSMAFASATFTFSGNCTLIGADGRIMREESADVDKNGLAVTTGDQDLVICSESLKLKVGTYSLLSLCDNGNETIIYLVYGEATVSALKASHIALYTPVSLIETVLSGDGEIYVATTDDEEITYNTTASAYIAFDSIRGKKISVAPQEGYDYLNGELCSTVPEETVTVPNAPVFREAVRKLICTPPEFSGLERGVYDAVPSSPVITDVNITYIPSSPLFEEPVTKLTGTPEAPLFKSTGVMTVTQNLIEEKDD